MAKYEYRIVVSATMTDDSDEQTLNELGGDGWDLVSAIADVRANEEAAEDDEDENIPVTVFYLKRTGSESSNRCIHAVRRMDTSLSL